MGGGRTEHGLAGESLVAAAEVELAAEAAQLSVRELMEQATAAVNLERKRVAETEHA
jgi:hypothetical protein